jgi:thiol-disulfide isomerase/thioredoxin
VFKIKLIPNVGYRPIWVFGLLLLLSISACQKSESNLHLDKLKPGDALPKIAFLDIHGKKTDFEKFKGKVVLLNFWATWCPPCIAEMPAMEKLYRAIGKDKFEIVAINVDPPTSKNDVIEFVKKHEITFNILFDPELISVNEFGVTGFPESIFVGKDSKIVAVIDPETDKPTTRLISDRPWDNEEYQKIINELIDNS